MHPHPAGDAIEVTAGPLQGRLYRDSGHIEIAGPDLDGQSLANVVTFQPPTVTVAGEALTMGPPTSPELVDDGVVVRQRLGDATSPLDCCSRKTG